ncbi:unnamed protein product [Nezara viridula]|uniref:STAS domain-containing protein n=1 Tax=Nezara viridula TaxID=85310 RepID=A0A9P0GYP6_NEZVI|nr:unnamed protein product [Nezara viridula]
MAELQTISVFKRNIHGDEDKIILITEGTTVRRQYLAMEEVNAQINISRKVLIQREAVEEVDEPKKESLLKRSIKLECNPKEACTSLIPAIKWLSEYNWKEWLVKDAISGFTVAVMNIPQGMAYALLANVPPVVGIYMAFFPVIIYAFLGTSRHVSMGSFAVICLMTGNTINKHVTDHDQDPAMAQITALGIGSTLAFLVGMYQIILYALRLGIVCTLLSDTLISGFTAGAAVHVFSSQLKDILGIKLPVINGPFKLVYVYTTIFERLSTANVAAVIISAITMVILVVNNEIIKPRIAKISRFPIPIELIVVTSGTLVSYLGHIAEIYNLRVVGKIPKGLPPPSLPNFSILPEIAVDGLIISLIAYIGSLSMALIFANKFKYEVNANQELFAQGMGNIFGSFFSCLPFAASLSRSVIQQSVGGVTQLASLINSSLILIVLLWIGPLFEPLPRCILASLIIVALKGVLMQALDIFKIWKASKIDGVIWIFTYLSVIIVEIEYGLLIGIIVSILSLIIRGASSRLDVLKRLPNSELYVEVEKYSKTTDLPGIRIVRYSGCLNFVNRSFFKAKLLKLLETNDPNENEVNKDSSPEILQETIILDFKCLTYIDPSGAECLKSLINELSRENKALFLAGLSADATETLRFCNVTKDTGVPIFPSIHDAVTFAQSKQTGVFTIRL